MIPNLQILNCDSVEGLKQIPDGSIECCVTSPPYDNLRTYAGHQWDFEGTARELYRVMCDGGVVCWNVNDACVDGSETLTSFKQAIFFKEKCGFRVHDTMIYQKHSFSYPEQVRYHSVFEYVFILSKGNPRAFNPLKDRKNVTAGRPCLGINTFIRPDGSREARATQGGVSTNYGMRYNVWKGPTRGQEEVCQAKAHPAMMPKWLARDLIRSWSNPGDTVLDPFAGSGTTAARALEYGRKAIAIEINKDYIPLIEETCVVQPVITQ